MKGQQSIGIGLLGLGVVGGGVAGALAAQKDALSFRAGGLLSLRRVLVRDVNKPRSLEIEPSLVTGRVEDVLSDPSVHIVVELMGGVEPAGDYIKRALKLGKHVVTANKDLVAQQGPELFELARSSKAGLLFEGAVGGAIPIIGPLTRDLTANDIHSIHAIINGTTNFILTNMAEKGMEAGDALALAQKLGYAESNPFNDVEGVDAAYKLSILATLAFHSRVSPQQVFREGITRLHARDFRYASELGYAIKLLAIAKRNSHTIEARVHPALVPERHLLAKVGGAFNAIEVEGDLLGRAVFHGLGAGQGPTTSAVLGDVVEIARRIATKAPPPSTPTMEKELRVKNMAEIESRCYYRLKVADRAGVLAQITRVLGDLNISIANIIQKDTDLENRTAEIVITTHPSKHSAVQKSVEQMERLKVVTEVSNLIRIEEMPT
ncbi:MAG: homoserine dehydrogenase [SAR202 cluster bacterium]|nr:homoserine dehydrogenase [SAR202 cluster bacterium]